MDTACSVLFYYHAIPNKPHSFEVIKIELLDESNSSIPGIKVAASPETDQLSVTKLLQNVEESYDKGKFLLEESCFANS